MVEESGTECSSYEDRLRKKAADMQRLFIWIEKQSTGQSDIAIDRTQDCAERCSHDVAIDTNAETSAAIVDAQLNIACGIGTGA